MGHTVEQWTNSIMSQMPRGILWQRATSLDLYKYAQGYAPRLEQVEASADSLLFEMRPETTYELLPEWEEYLGLPECNAAPSSNIEYRRFAVVEKYHRKGGLQAWNIQKLAEDLGFTVKVEEVFLTTAYALVFIRYGNRNIDTFCALQYLAFLVRT